MSLSQLFDQFLGGGGNGSQNGNSIQQNVGNKLSGLGDKIPGGALGGLAAGGLLGVLAGNKKMRKTVGKVAGGAVGLGGAAILGAVAFNAYKGWKTGSPPNASSANANSSGQPENMPHNPNSNEQYQLAAPDIEPANFNPVKAVAADGNPLQITLIKAMIAAANADGHIDKDEQANIFEAVNRLDLDQSDKALVFDTLQNPPSVSQIASMSNGLEQASEIYLASRLAIDPDNEDEHKYLTNLVMMLQLPDDLIVHLEDQLRATMV